MLLLARWRCIEYISMRPAARCGMSRRWPMQGEGVGLKARNAVATWFVAPGQGFGCRIARPLRCTDCIRARAAVMLTGELWGAHVFVAAGGATCILFVPDHRIPFGDHPVKLEGYRDD